MAEIIPSLSRETLSRMTAGEKRLAQRFKDLLEDDYLVWYDIPVGRKRRYPDFIVLHPRRGLLFLEVKDWKPETLKKITTTDVELLTSTGLVTKSHPLEQVRQYAYAVINNLIKDSHLRKPDQPHKGNLIMPYGWGVVLTNITRKQIEKAIPEDARERLLPDHLMIYKDGMTESADAEAFQSLLCGMFNYQFSNVLSLPQIDRVRYHLFPEIRIGEGEVADLFGEEDAPEEVLPDIVRIMDIQQEQLARSLGEGHRVIHGVAGSGKTLILGFRCLHLAQAMTQPILVLCFNITLAAKLRAFISSRGIGSQVQVYHFHDWCALQLKTYHIDLVQSDAPHYERQVESVISAVEKGQIPRAQYGALLIDEGHDFEADWLKLITQMVDPETNSLLLLYDDAQSIYKKKSGLGFTLSSVGIQAKGRTTILKLNYRNTREILKYAYDFANHYLEKQDADDEDQVPLIEPEAAGTTGPEPVLKRLDSVAQEAEYALAAIRKWHADGVAYRDVAILYPSKRVGTIMAEALKRERLPHLWLNSRKEKLAYDPAIDQVNLLTIHSSKGLEFPRVIMVGTGELGAKEDRLTADARLCYVGMTRAQECLLVTCSGRTEFMKEPASSS